MYACLFPGDDPQADEDAHVETIKRRTGAK